MQLKRPLSDSRSIFDGSTYGNLTKQARQTGIAGNGMRDFNVQTEAPINTNLKMRPFYEDYVAGEPDDTDQLLGFNRYDLIFVLRWNTTTTISDIGTKTFTLQGINRFMHEKALEKENYPDRYKNDAFDVQWFKDHVSFDGILNDDKSSQRIWGEMEKTAAILNQGITRLPCCFDEPDVPAFNRLGFIVKEVCVKKKTTYVTDTRKPNGKTLDVPKSGHVVRVIPIALKRRYPTLFCHECGKPDDPGKVYLNENCPHKDKILLYEHTPKGKTMEIRKAHYIPFGTTEQGNTGIAEFPNMYRKDSEINCIQYQLNEHLEFWNRSC